MALKEPAGQGVQNVKFEELNEPAGQTVQEDAKPPRLIVPEKQVLQLVGGET